MKDVVLCAWAAPCSGPGWSNQPIRYIVSCPAEKIIDSALAAHREGKEKV